MENPGWSKIHKKIRISTKMQSLLYWVIMHPPEQFHQIPFINDEVLIFCHYRLI